MRLINIDTLRFEEFYGDDIPEYLILSHTWGAQEVLFQNFLHDMTQSTPEHPSMGAEKIRGFCKYLAHLRYLADLRHSGRDPHEDVNDEARYAFEFIAHVWVDTCCIDKRSSAELSEAINSMCFWYQAAVGCVVYLADVEAGDISGIFKSRWWTRGWTLQELLAPSNVTFVAKDWSHLACKSQLGPQIRANIGIPTRALSDLTSARGHSVAAIMSWAAHRETTRIEDRAYSLLGLFDISMPLLYGEGNKAFRRLQEEIVKSSRDLSLFAWGLCTTPLSFSKGAWPKIYNTRTRNGISMFAQSPCSFAQSGKVQTMHRVSDVLSIDINNLGLRMGMAIMRVLYRPYSVGFLSCSISSRPDLLLGVFLWKTDSSIYYRLAAELPDSTGQQSTTTATFVLDLSSVPKTCIGRSKASS